MPKNSITSIGTASRDVFLRSRAIKVIRDDNFFTGQAECFSLGSKLEVDDIVFDIGGGAANTAVSFTRQGLGASFYGKLGYLDDQSDEIVSSLKKDGVNVNKVIYDHRFKTAYSVILLTQRGERTVLIYRGAASDLSPHDIRHLKINSPWIYVTSIGGRLDTLEVIWSIAKHNRIKIAWNPGATELSYGRQKLTPFLKETAFLSVNQEEMNSLLGHSSGPDITGFRHLQELVGGLAMVTLGAGGALLGDQQNTWRSYTRSIKVIDTTGAGDAFGSGFVGSYIRTNNITKSLCFATANAESVISHIGSQPGLLSSTTRLPKILIKKL